eukprot:204173_1
MYQTENDPRQSEHKSHGYKLLATHFLLPDSSEGAVSLYKYFKYDKHNGIVDHCLRINKGTDTNQNGYKFEEALGYCFSANDHPSYTVALHEFYSAANHDHLYTIHKSEIGENLQPGQVGDNGYKYKGIICYVYDASHVKNIPKHVTLSYDGNPEFDKMLNWEIKPDVQGLPQLGYRIKTVVSAPKPYLEVDYDSKHTILNVGGSRVKIYYDHRIQHRNDLRTMQIEYKNNYDVGKCSEACAHAPEKFKYIGLQKPDQCWCSNSDAFMNNPQSDGCDGGKGGDWLNDVYEIDHQDRQLNRIGIQRYWHNGAGDHMYEPEHDPYHDEAEHVRH